MNETEIYNLLKSDKYTSKYFLGVMSYDRLPQENPPPGLYVVNTDVSTGPGKHWVCIFFGNTTEYFDSLGRPPQELKSYLKQYASTYMYSTKRIQGIGSDVCGDYCILYAYFRCRGKSMNAFVNMFSDNLDENDILVEM